MTCVAHGNQELAISIKMEQSGKHTLPIALGELAIKLGMATSEVDKRTKDLLGVWGMYVPTEENCQWIGDAPAAAAAAKVVNTNPPTRAIGFGQFEPLPGIGKPGSSAPGRENVFYDLVCRPARWPPRGVT